jgi:hypothetical protein
VSPSLVSLSAFEGMGSVMVEFRFRVSERNQPGAELVDFSSTTAVLNNTVLKDCVTTKGVEPQSEQSAAEIERLEALLSKLRA